MRQDEFSTRDVAKILGISERQAIDWAERGLFTADIQAAQGLGSRRRFSYGGILVAALALHLKNNYKIPREQIKFIVEAFRLHLKSETNQLEELSEEIAEALAGESAKALMEKLKEEQPKSYSLPEIFSECFLVLHGFSDVLQIISRDEFDKKYFFDLIIPVMDSTILTIINLAKIKATVDEAIGEMG